MDGLVMKKSLELLLSKGVTTFNKTTLSNESIMALSITTLSINQIQENLMSLFVTLSINDTRHK
jgi:hypothetical protein